jgi:multicomponent Na+:H+ antiporter subunit B
MKIIISIILLGVIAFGLFFVLSKIPFGEPKTKVGDYYTDNGREETGATNIVTSVVVNYRGFDTLGEITVLFIAATGLGAVLFRSKKTDSRKPDKNRELEPASLILSTGCKFLFPFI